MPLIFTLDDQPALLARAAELTYSHRFSDEAIAIGVTDENGRELAAFVVDEVVDDHAEVHWGAAAPLRRSIIPMCLDFAFRSTGADYLTTTIAPWNTPMLLVALKVGWRVVGFEAGDGEVPDVVVLRIERAPWLPPAGDAQQQNGGPQP